MNNSGLNSQLLSWHYQRDAHRVTPLPGGALVTIYGPDGSVGTLRQGISVLMEIPNGATVLLPDLRGNVPVSLEFPGIKPLCGLLLDDPANLTFEAACTNIHAERLGICSNYQGACVQARAAWGTLQSQYDSLLAANFCRTGPGDRRNVLVKIDLKLRIGQFTIPVQGGHVRRFQVLSHRQLRWDFECQRIRWQITLTLEDGNAVSLTASLEGTMASDATLSWHPVVDQRLCHNVTKAFAGPEKEYPAAVQNHAQGAFSFALPEGKSLEVCADTDWQPSPSWEYCVALPIEQERALADATDCFCPGHFVWDLGSAESFTLRASVVPDSFLAESPPQSTSQSSSGNLPTRIREALNLYLVDRDGETTVLAGFPWFMDWGRDSLIFCRGLIAVGEWKAARSILHRFGKYESGGSLPNVLRGGEITNRHTSDAPLWWILALSELSAVEPGIFDAACGDRTLGGIAVDLVKAKLAGAEHGVRCDPASGLLWSPAHFTWMDTDAPAGTPREGYAIEIQALWHAALTVVHQLEPDLGADHLAAAVRRSVDRLFWLETEGYLSDCLHHAAADVPAAQAVADDHLRPNQLFAITLGLVTDPARRRSILENCQQLLVPGAIGTLANKPVRHPLAVSWQGQPLNAPNNPYWPRYSGVEDKTRKPAYHNGTAWCWILPSYAEALAMHDPNTGGSIGRRLLSGSAELLEAGCIGQLPEILDGSLSHMQKGCPAQAWSISEWVRVWKFLSPTP